MIRLRWDDPVRPLGGHLPTKRIPTTPDDVLRAIARHEEPTTMGATHERIGAELKLAGPSVFAHVQKLKMMGLASADRRRGIVLTPAGREALAKR